VAVRHRALQRWVDRVAAHPEMSATDAFRKFVAFPAEALASLREGSRTELVKGVAEEGKKTVLRLVKLASVQVQSAIAQARGAPAPSSAATAGASVSVEDMSFSELEVYLLGQAPLLTALYNEAAAVAVRAREQAQLLLDFGASLRALGQSEGGMAAAPGGPPPPSSLGTSLVAVGLASWAASTASYEEAVCETELFVERLADYVRGTRAVKEAVESRARASAELAEAQGELERLRAFGVALANSPPTATSGKDKAQNETDMAAAQKASAAAREFYDRAAAGLIGEVERMRGQMRADFKGMLLDLVSVQVRTELKLSQAWTRIEAEAARAAAAEGAPLAAIAGGAALGSAAMGVGASAADY